MVASLVAGSSLVAQLVKNLLAMQETWVRSLGWEDPLRREWLPAPVFLLGESHGKRKPDRLQCMGWQRVRHDRETNTFAFSCCGDQALGHTGFCSCKCGLSGCSSQPLQHRLSSCGTQAWLLHGMWNHHRPKIEAISCIGRQILYH